MEFATVDSDSKSQHVRVFDDEHECPLMDAMLAQLQCRVLHRLGSRRVVVASDRSLDELEPKLPSGISMSALVQSSSRAVSDLLIDANNLRLSSSFKHSKMQR